MRRTILSALALACTAVLASTVPAFADTPTPVPSNPASATPSPAPSTGGGETGPKPAPSVSSPAPAADVPTPVPSVSSPAAAPAPARSSEGGQVSTVPAGAPDTGVSEPRSTGVDGGLVGAGAGSVLLAGGAVAFVVRRRRATGA
ncbi:sortase-dependent protein [Streptomyces sp. NPDC047725]|uniref:sortase-dependent protein n=1 Tax=Streptomyces sp. NPDC047725 TaxID=3365487 RepID=UPI00371CE80C